MVRRCSTKARRSEGELAGPSDHRTGPSDWTFAPRTVALSDRRCSLSARTAIPLQTDCDRRDRLHRGPGLTPGEFSRT